MRVEVVSDDEFEALDRVLASAERKAEVKRGAAHGAASAPHVQQAPGAAAAADTAPAAAAKRKAVASPESSSRSCWTAAGSGAQPGEPERPARAASAPPTTAAPTTQALLGSEPGEDFPAPAPASEPQPVCELLLEESLAAPAAPAGAQAPRSGSRRLPASLTGWQPLAPVSANKQQQQLGGSTKQQQQPGGSTKQQQQPGGSTKQQQPVAAAPRLPALRYEGSTVYATTPDEVDRLVGQLLVQRPAVVGLDCEWRTTYVKGQAPRRVSLLQICACLAGGRDVAPGPHGAGALCLLLQVFYTGITPKLKELLACEDIVKVGVNITGDANKLRTDYGVRTAACSELGDEANRRVLVDVADVTVGVEAKRWSLAGLCAEVTRMAMAKEDTPRLSNWEARPLHPQQREYAAVDAYASLALHWALHALPLRPTLSQQALAGAKTPAGAGRAAAATGDNTPLIPSV